MTMPFMMDGIGGSGNLTMSDFNRPKTRDFDSSQGQQFNMLQINTTHTHHAEQASTQHTISYSAKPTATTQKGAQVFHQFQTPQQQDQFTIMNTTAKKRGRKPKLYKPFHFNSPSSYAPPMTAPAKTSRGGGAMERSKVGSRFGATQAGQGTNGNVQRRIVYMNDNNNIGVSF